MLVEVVTILLFKCWPSDSYQSLARLNPPFSLHTKDVWFWAERMNELIDGNVSCYFLLIVLNNWEQDTCGSRPPHPVRAKVLKQTTLTWTCFLSHILTTGSNRHLAHKRFLSVMLFEACTYRRPWRTWYVIFLSSQDNRWLNFLECDITVFPREIVLCGCRTFWGYSEAATLLLINIYFTQTNKLH